MSKGIGPWFKFYPADWRGEASLRAVSMAARGLWIEMLCLMHEAEPRGHLLLNGRPVTDAQLASLAGVPSDIAQALLGELEGAGTFSRTRAGVIYSRRMRADTALSAKQRANVEKRWSKEGGSDDPQPPDKTPQTGSRITDVDTKAIPKKPEKKIKKETPHSPPLGGELGQADVEAIWAIAPPESRKRSGKKDVARALLAAVRRGRQPATVLAGLKAYFASPMATKDEGAFVKGVHRMIENDRWEAFVETSATAGEDWPESRWRVALGIHAEDGRWGETMGPPPGQPGCRAPSPILAEFGFPTVESITGAAA